MEDEFHNVSFHSNEEGNAGDGGETPLILAQHQVILKEPAHSPRQATDRKQAPSNAYHQGGTFSRAKVMQHHADFASRVLACDSISNT